MSDPGLYLGYHAHERAASPYADYFNAHMAPLPAHVREALAQGAVAPALLPPLQRAPDLLDPGYWPAETGYTLTLQGEARVFVLTHMPDVQPAMWDWWFAWHGSEAQRYKLWHPRAHVHVAWADGRSDLTHYIGRTSQVVEYVGPTQLRINIRFVSPHTLGLDPVALAARGEVAVCARGGLAGTPFETGWLVHHLRPVPGGCEMRSRFWMGGPHVRPKGMPGCVGAWLGNVARRVQPIHPWQAAELLVHCAQEMNHLAAFLPSLYAQFGPTPSPISTVEGAPKCK